jgi:hypothetical protein
MKERNLITMMFSGALFISLANVLGKNLTLPSGNAGIENKIGGNIPLEPTAEELAEPPEGEIQKLYLRNVNEARFGLATLLVAVPDGLEGRQSPLYLKLNTVKLGLDQLASSRMDAHLFSLIPLLAEIHQSESEDVPDFAGDAIGLLQHLSPPILHTIARHVVRKEAHVAAADLVKFIEVFTAGRGLFSEGDWEDEMPPINAAGVMILDAAAVESQLKASGWQSAKQFLGGADQPTVFFADYISSGGGLSTLKAKYALNHNSINAKFLALKDWVGQQEAAASPP